MDYQIELGDYVRHVNPLINGGLRMCVEDISEDGINAKCSHFVGADVIHKIDWFPILDLILIQKNNGDFIN